jgi:hypothetical protein
MNSSLPRLNEEGRQHIESIVVRHMHRLFQRLPMLCGFSLRADLELDEVSVFGWSGHTAGRDVYEAVMRSLVELAEERPEAMHIMRGRTFARAVH